MTETLNDNVSQETGDFVQWQGELSTSLGDAAVAKVFGQDLMMDMLPGLDNKPQEITATQEKQFWSDRDEPMASPEEN